MLHTLSAHLLVLQQKNINMQPYSAAFKRLVESLKKLVPCENCRQNYNTNLRVIDIAAYGNDPHNLFIWTCDLHNIVNAETQKPQFPVQQAIRKYQVMPINQQYWCNPRNFEDSMWKMLHCIAGNLVMKQEEQHQNIKLEKQAFVTFMNNLLILVPCDDFRNKLLAAIAQQPLKNNLNSARQIFQWTYTIHNTVNTFYRRQQLNADQFYRSYGLLPQKKV